MDIERLKELHRIVSNEFEVFNEKTQHFCITPIGKDLITLIDEAIDRQSVTSEEVRRAIELLREPSKYMDYYWLDAQMNDALNLAITALKEDQPWVPVSEHIPTKSELRNGMVLAWSTELSEWQVESWVYVEDRPEDYTHWKPLPEPPKGETE